MYTITNTSVTFILSNYWTVTYLYGSALTNCIVHVLIVILVVVKLLNSKLVVFALTNCNVHNVVLVHVVVNGRQDAWYYMMMHHTITGNVCKKAATFTDVD